MEIIPINYSYSFSKIKAIIFDWDGVFHSGYKNHLGESLFSEADSMGVNMLRLALYLDSTEIPYTAIITGENNPTAQFLANREHFDAVFTKAKDKKQIVQYLKEKHNIAVHEILFAFDDILDLSLAKEVGYRFLVKRNASGILENYIKENQLCDFVTENDGGNHAVREICEFVMAKMDLINSTIQTRMEHGEVYQTFLANRKKIQTEIFEYQDGAFKK